MQRVDTSEAVATVVPPARPAGAIRRTLAALAYRDFRLLWLGSFTSSIGTWMQNVAENWLVLSLTGSPFFLGLDAFMQQLPILLFTLLGGVLADRLDRRRTLLVSQYVQMACAFTLALLVFLKLVHVWHILFLSFVTGCAQAFGGPASQALVPSLVEKKDLPNAVALNSIQFNLARVVGPLLAGAMLAAFGMVSCFSLNGLSFLVVIGALLSLRVRQGTPSSPKRFEEELREGFSYVRRRKAVMALCILAATTTFLGFAVITFLPLFAQRVFHQSVGLYSRLLAFSGVGSVMGALVVGWLGRYRKMGVVALAVQGTCGLLIVLFALSRVLWLSEAVLFLMGAALLVTLATLSSLVQLVVPDELRGRVMSIFMTAFRGGMPLGSILAGFLAVSLGPAVVLASNGVVLFVVAVLFSLRGPSLREL